MQSNCKKFDVQWSFGRFFQNQFKNLLQNNKINVLVHELVELYINFYRDEAFCSGTDLLYSHWCNLIRVAFVMSVCYGLLSVFLNYYNYKKFYFKFNFLK